jgi:hypothetical protein
MNTKDQAKEKMQKYVDFQNNLRVWNEWGVPDITIYENLTKEKDFGWIFYWQRKNADMNDIRTFVVGNGPIIIEKDTLDMYAMMTALSVEDNIKVYLEDKNKLAKLEIDSDGNFDVVNIDD